MKQLRKNGCCGVPGNNGSSTKKNGIRQTSNQKLRAAILQAIHTYGGQATSQNVYSGVKKLIGKRFTKYDKEIVDGRPRWKKRLSREIRVLCKYGLLEKIEEGILRLTTLGLSLICVCGVCGVPGNNG